MKKILFMTPLLLVVSCQNPSKVSQNEADNLVDNTHEISKKSKATTLSLPMMGEYKEYDPNNRNTHPVKTVRQEGRLTIENGCVSLTNPKDRYPNRAEPYSNLLIFPQSSKFVKNGQAIMVNNKVFQDGDFVEMGGGGAGRDFWKYYPELPHTPFPKHCTADKYWRISSNTGLKLMK